MGNIQTGLRWPSRLRPLYEIVEYLPGKPLVIRDIGYDKAMTVTNGAEGVVEELVEQGLLPEGRRLFYYDSENTLDEILVENGRFAGFRPGPGR